MVAALVTAFLVWCAVAWVGLESLDRDRQGQEIGRERQLAEQLSSNISVGIGLSLIHLPSVPLVLASMPSLELTAALTRYGPHGASPSLSQEERLALWRSDRRLQQIASHLSLLAAETGLNMIFVMNATGDCIASGEPQSTNQAIGRNFADRDYFRDNLRGRTGRQFGFSRSFGGMPALLLSVPVIVDGIFVGAIGAEVHLFRLPTYANTLITDENGVIILAHDPNLVMRVLPSNSLADMPPEERRSQYDRVEFETIPLSPAGTRDAPDLVYWNGEVSPRILVSRSLPLLGVTVHVLHDLPGINVFQQERPWLYALLLAIGFLMSSLVAVGLAYLRRHVEHSRDLEGLNRLLSNQANADPLTGSANRRRFLSALDNERHRARRHGSPFCMVSIDFDHFKSINDQFGHAAGDQALCHFVSIATTLLRPNDLLGRMGGEEFCLLLPETDLYGAVSVAERLRSAVEATALIYEDSPILLTLSAGIAQWHGAIDESQDSLLKRADRALYRAKRAGRNCVLWDLPSEAA